MNNKEFREAAHKTADLIADYFETIRTYDVVPGIEPGDIINKIPDKFPEEGEPYSKITEDFQNIILNGITHWNHPGFMAYFNSTSSGPAILAEFFAAAVNTNAMIWKTSPASTELETAMMGWFRQFVGLPDEYTGLSYDTASVSSLHALIAAREYYRQKSGIKNYSGLRVFISPHAHSSLEKNALAIGLEREAVIKVPCDDKFRIDPVQLKLKIGEAKKSGYEPFFVSATIGTTSTTSVDPVGEIAQICRDEGLWLHTDAAYAGVTSSLQEKNEFFKGWENSDSIVLNPHKWLFVPIDLSILFTNKPEILKDAFSLTPEYLRTNEESQVINYMDYGFQLGRRFRILKLWFLFRYYGAEKLRSFLRTHLNLAGHFKKFIENSDEFELKAPVNFATVCFRVKPEFCGKSEVNEFNEQLMNEINKTGKIFISHTKLNDDFVIRLVSSGFRTEKQDVDLAINLIKEKLKELQKIHG